MIENQKRPKVSIVMPAYNAEVDIEESINSVLNQTLVDFELILIEDGSTDRTKEIIKEFAKKDPRIKLVLHKENQKIIQSLNDGLKVARGQYIARLDSDDIAAPDRLERQYIYLQQHPETYLIGTGAYFIDEEGKRIRQFFPIVGVLENEKAIPEGKSPLHPSIMFRNEGKFLYRKNALHCDDLDLFLQMLSAGKKIDNITDPLLFYRFRTRSLTSENYPKIIEISTRIREIYKNDPKNYPKNLLDFDPVKYTEERGKFVDYSKVSARYRVQYFFTMNNFEMAREAIKEYKVKYKMDWKLSLIYLLTFFPVDLIEFFRTLKHRIF